MKRRDPVNRETWDLIDLACNGQISQEELRQLEAALLDDPSAQNFYLDYCQLHAELCVVQGAERAARTVGAELESRVPPRHAIERLGDFVRRIPQYVARPTPLSIAAALVVMLGGLAMLSGVYLEGRPDEPTASAPNDETPRPIVAQVAIVKQGVWASVDKAMSPGDPLYEGETIRLRGGAVELEYSSGVKVLLQQSVDYRVDGGGSGTLLAGRISAHVPRSGLGFVVNTSLATFVDLGTEFGVDVSENGSVDVAVFEGRVLAAARGGEASAVQPSVVLHANEAMRFSPFDAAGAGVRIASDPARFRRDFHESQPPGLIVAPEYVAAVKAARPLFYWRFESLSKDRVANAAGQGFEALVGDGVSLGGDPGNRFARFPAEGKNRVITVAESIDELSGESYTFELWVRPDETRLATLIGMNHADGPVCLFELRSLESDEMRPPASIRFLHRMPPGEAGGTRIYTKQNAYRSRRWQHLVAVKRASVMSVYRNGVHLGSEVEPSRLPTRLSFWLGRGSPNEIDHADDRPKAARQFVGQIDELAVYPRALAEDEIRRHYRLASETE